MGDNMIPRRKPLAFALLLLVLVPFAISDDKSDKAQKLTDEQRQVLIRNFQSELVFSKCYFPMGKQGLRIENGQVTPSEPEVRQLVADLGPAAKPGDRVKITAIYFKGRSIILELNGGPVKKKKWYERISVESAGGGVRPADKTNDDSLYVNARGSFVALIFKDYIPNITPEQMKQLLSPVFDFNATSAVAVYTASLPPAVQQALKNHKALVGMDREMVTYALGRPPKKYRDRDGETDYEEWIYGEPPNEVQFIRFVGDRVVRIEQMKVDGQKIVRTEKELDLDKGESSAVAAKRTEEQQEDAKKGPSLLKPGEKPVLTNASGGARQSGVPGNPNDRPAQDPTSDRNKGGIDASNPNTLPQPGGVPMPSGGPPTAQGPPIPPQ